MENDPNKSLSGKPREFGNFAKTQGILFAQVVNYLILKVKDICCKNFLFSFRISICAPSQFCVCNGHKSRKFIGTANICCSTGKTQGI